MKTEENIVTFINNLEAENQDIECKQCKRILPKDLWSTYSAFANTHGGKIILGITEIKNIEKNKFEITGVENPTKVCDDFWTCISNTNKVNYNLLSNNDVQIKKIEDKSIIIINVPEATHQQKPIYLNNVLTNTYIRLNSADVKVNIEQLQILLRNRNLAQDVGLLKNYTIERDLDLLSIQKYRQHIFEHTHDTKYLDMDISKFLIQMGALKLDYNDNKYYITEGGLLFFGKIDAIINRFPHFHLDYFDRRGNNARWSDRVASDDMSFFNLNLMNYFFLIMEKLQSTITDDFELEKNLIRKSPEKLLVILREALINMIVHADYYVSTSSIIVNVYSNYYEFNNPGMMLVSTEEFIKGGNSCPRNTVIMTLFRRLGLSERAGSGGPEIFDFAITNSFKQPQVETNFKETNIKIWKVDLVSTYPNLSKEAKLIFTYIDKNGKNKYTAKELKEELKLSKYVFQRAIKELSNTDLIVITGNGRGRAYSKSLTKLELYVGVQKLADRLRMGN